EEVLSSRSLSKLCADKVPSGVIGIETWDRFPTGLYSGLTQLEGVRLAPSTVVEDLRLVKSDYEIGILRQAAAVGDKAHEVVVELLTSGKVMTEQELVRAAEYAIRRMDPVYEDSSSSGPAMICSGKAVGKSLLHRAHAATRIRCGR